MPPPPPVQDDAAQDPNAALTKAVRTRKQVLAERTARILERMTDLGDAQEEIRALEVAHARALQNDAKFAYEALLERGRLRTVRFEEKELGVGFVLARFDAEGGGDEPHLSRRLVVVETTRPLGVARRMLAPTDELVGVAGAGGDVRDGDLVADPTVGAFEKLLARLRDGHRPLDLVFALGPQREAALAAAVAAEREEASSRRARRAAAREKREKRRKREDERAEKATGADLLPVFLSAAFPSDSDGEAPAAADPWPTPPRRRTRPSDADLEIEGEAFWNSYRERADGGAELWRATREARDLDSRAAAEADAAGRARELVAVLESIAGRRPAWDIFKPLYLAQIELVFHDS